MERRENIEERQKGGGDKMEKREYGEDRECRE